MNGSKLDSRVSDALIKAKASPKLALAISKLPRVVAGKSFLDDNHKLRIYDVSVTIWAGRKGRAAGAYIWGRINADPEVNVFLAEHFSAHLGPMGGIKEFVLNTFGSRHTFGTKTRTRASMWDYYYRTANQEPEMEIEKVEVKEI